MRAMDNDGIEMRRKIYNYILQHYCESGVAPSYRQICQYVGRTLPVVFHHIAVLEELGLVINKGRKGIIPANCQIVPPPQPQTFELPVRIAARERAKIYGEAYDNP